MKQRHSDPNDQRRRGGRLPAAIGTSRLPERQARNGMGRALGALAIGAFAVGAVAVGAVAIGRLTIGRARIRRLEIDELVVRKLTVTGHVQTPPPEAAE